MNSNSVPAIPIEPIAVDAARAAAMLGISRSAFYKQVSVGRIGPEGRRLGKCVRWSLAELRAWGAAGMPDRATWQRRVAS